MHTSRNISAFFSFFLACVLSFSVLVRPCSALATPLLPADLRGETVPFLPYLDYMLDENGTLDIDAVALQDKNLHFVPLKPLDLDLKTGTFWLRFTLAPLAEGAKPVEWLLSLGESLPGDPQLYVPEIQALTGMQQWRVIPVTDRHILNLPEAGSEPKTCYIRLAGPPGLWFAPMLHSPHNAANNWGPLARPAAVLILLVLMLLCLLRSASEHGQWRIWTALFVGGALASGYLGLPTVERGHIGLSQFACAFAPGLSLMVLPHIARHLMRTSVFSRIVDAQLIVLTLVGAAVTLLPLVPGFSWTSRFLELWPLATVFFLPTALWALFLGLPGSARFLLICMIPPLLTAVGILGLLSGFAADTLAACPLCGIALSSLLLVTAPNPPQPETAPKKEKNAQKGLSLDGPLSMEQNSDDLSLQLVTTQADTEGIAAELPDHETKPKVSFQLLQNKALDLIAEPLDTMSRAQAALEQCSLPPAVREHAATMMQKAKEIQGLLQGTLQPIEEEPDKNSAIDLQLVMRDIYNKAIQTKHNDDLAIGWYMPPDLPAMYQGNVKLQQALELLAESAVRATPTGTVHMTVQQFPESDEPGHLLFTVTDTGSGTPPRSRSGYALTRAWQVCGECHGALTLKTSSSGTTVLLSCYLQPMSSEQEALKMQQPLVMVCSENTTERKKIAQYLNDMPCNVLEVRNLVAAQVRCHDTPALLIITHDSQATPTQAPIIAQIREEALNQGLPFCKLLAITPTDQEWPKLGKAGFTYALKDNTMEPLDVEALRTTVQNVLEDAAKNKAQQKVNKPAPTMTDLLGMGKVPENLKDLTHLEHLLKNFERLGGTKTTEHKDQQNVAKTAPVRKPSIKEDRQPSSQQPAPTSQSFDAQESFEDLLKDIHMDTADPSKSSQHTNKDSAPAAARKTANESALPLTEPLAKLRMQAASKEAMLKKQKNQSSTVQTQSEDLLSALSQESLERTLQEVLQDDFVESQQTQASPSKRAESSSTLKNPYYDTEDWVGEPQPIPQKQKPAPSNTLGNAPYTADEWVGEPMPVPKKKEASSNKPSAPLSDHPIDPYATPRQAPWHAARQGEMRGNEAFEWVGEPVPVPKKPTPAQAKDNLSATQQQANLAAEQHESSVQKGTVTATMQETQNSREESASTRKGGIGPDPAILALVKRLDDAVAEAKAALEAKQILRVTDAVKRIAHDCDAFGFRRLARFARTVEQAGKAGDLKTVKDFLLELANQIERNNITLTQIR